MRKLLNIRVIIGGVAVAILLSAALAAYLLLVRHTTTGNLPPDSAEMTLIPASTPTPRFPSPTATSVLPTLAPSPTTMPGSFALGVYVQIFGTGGDGLNLRAMPGLSSDKLFGAAEAEVFQITNGPEEADGYTWWFLTAPYDAARSGWAAQTYLAVITPP